MAGRIPQTFIDDLVARSDIAEVIGTRVSLRKAGREYKGLCPFHGEKTPSFTVSPDKGFYHCFGCGAHGTAIGFLMEHDHLSFVEAVEQIAADLGIDVPREAGSRHERGSDEVADLLRRSAEIYVEALRQSDAAIEYLRTRGIDGDTAKRFQLGYAPDAWDTIRDSFGSDAETRAWLDATGLLIRRDDGKTYDRFRGRIMFPIRDARGRVIAFGGRIVGQGEPKYLNSPETVLFSKRRELYGLYEARKRLRDIPRLVVVEGYMDVVALSRHGIDYAVATLGTATTPEHLNRVFRVTDELVFCFDGDRAGRQAAWRALETALPEARDGRMIRFAFLPDGEDPDSLVSKRGAAAFEAILTSAIGLSEFLVDELTSQVDTGSVAGRARLAELARPLLGRLPDGVYRQLLIDALAERVGIKAAKLEELLGGSAPAPRATGPSRRTRQVRQQELSLVARAIRALLHRPTLADKADPEWLTGLRRPGVDLLIEILEICQENPHLTSAAVLERLRNHRHIRHLENLLSTELVEHDELDLTEEFSGCVQTLKRAAVKEQIDDLIRREAEGGLDADGRRTLTELQQRLAAQTH